MIAMKIPKLNSVHCNAKTRQTSHASVSFWSNEHAQAGHMGRELQSLPASMTAALLTI